MDINVIRTGAEIKRSVILRGTITVSVGFGLLCLALTLHPLMGLWVVPVIAFGISFVVIGPLSTLSDIEHASREDILELIKDMHGFADIERLFCAYMRERSYLTIRESSMFEIQITQEHEKLEDKKYQQQIESLCKNH